METLGDLLDKLSISQIRLEKLKEEGYDKDKIDAVKKQRDQLGKEITEFLDKAMKGLVVLQAPKTKIYHHEEESGSKAETLGEAASKLAEANYKLWNLEDFRRDKENSDADRLKACDDVSVWNRKRNDCMDLVNSILVKTINGDSERKIKKVSGKHENGENS